MCGTDLHSYKGEWDRPTPIVLGHEGAGVIEAVGDEVDGARAGDRVVLSWAPACGACDACRRNRPAACGPLSRAIGGGTLLGGRTGISLDGETVYRGTATGALAEHVVVDAGAALPLGDDSRSSRRRCSAAPRSPASVRCCTQLVRRRASPPS